jgi:hypothetical protein
MRWKPIKDPLERHVRFDCDDDDEIEDWDEMFLGHITNKNDDQSAGE